MRYAQALVPLRKAVVVVIAKGGVIDRPLLTRRQVLAITSAMDKRRRYANCRE